MMKLIFSTIFPKLAEYESKITSLESSLKESEKKVNELTNENKILKSRSEALERLKKVFIDEGDRFFFAAKTKKNKFAFVTLDKIFQEIKIWGEYTVTANGKMAEDCLLKYKFKIWDEEKSLQVSCLESTTKNQGYAALAIEALSRIAYVHDLQLITIAIPPEKDQHDTFAACSRLGFKKYVNENSDVDKFYMEI